MINQLNFILLQQQAGGSQWSGMLMILALIVVFYFFMIRPQQKRQKEIKKAREAMKKGDKIITSGGIFGKIYDVKESEIWVEIAPEVRIRVSKDSVFPAAEGAPQDNK